MTRYTYTRSELATGKPAFLLDIQWGNKTYYLSNIDIRIQKNDGTYLEYIGSIQDFNFIESMDITGEDIEANILSCAVIFEDNPIEQFSKGNPIEGSSGVFSYVIHNDGYSEITHENRVILLTGTIQEPQYGDPLEVDGFVSFSLEQDQIDSDSPIIEPRLRIDTRFTNRNKDTSEGKPWPILIGIPTGYSSPAYVIQEGTGTTSPTKWLIAGHEIEASQVSIQDDKFDTKDISVSTGVDNNGNPFAQLSFTAPLSYSGVALPLTGGWTSGTTRSYWISLNNTNGGGMPNPFGEGLLEGGGDICRWALSKTRSKIDYQAWAGIAPILNKYKFAGYINDPEVSAWDWLIGNIIPWLPISIRTGPHGLTPVLNQMQTITNLEPICDIDIDTNAEIEQISAVETMMSTSDLINQYTFSYNKRGYSQDYTKHVRVTDIEIKNYDIRSDYSARSINLYGVKNGSGHSDYVYDDDTAAMIALQQVNKLSFPNRSINISAPFHYGWLQIGDIINVNSGNLFLSNQKSILIEKEWVGSYWRFKLIYELNNLK